MMDLELRAWTIAHPRLSEPLVVEGYFSEGPMRMFALNHLMQKFPDEFDMEDMSLFTVTSVVLDC
jgi:hypothetical protein